MATVAETSIALRELGDRGQIYAGGAELLLLMRQGLLATEVLVNIKNIDRLNGLSWDGNVLKVGACVTHHTLEKNPVVLEHAPSLAHAESQVANVRVRNQGTLGGNLCLGTAEYKLYMTCALLRDALEQAVENNGRRG